MKCSDLCLAVCIGMVQGAATAEDEIPAIISVWHEATANTKAVRASVHLIRYDNLSHTQKHATGTFGYLSPHHGFWHITGDTAGHQKRRVAPSGVQYKIQPFQDEHLRWHANQFRVINDNDKSFSEFELIW